MECFSRSGGDCCPNEKMYKSHTVFLDDPVNNNMDSTCMTADMNQALSVGKQNANGRQNIQVKQNVSESILHGINHVPIWINTHVLPSKDNTRLVLRWAVVFAFLTAAFIGLSCFISGVQTPTTGALRIGSLAQ